MKGLEFFRSNIIVIQFFDLITISLIMEFINKNKSEEPENLKKSKERIPKSFTSRYN